MSSQSWKAQYFLGYVTAMCRNIAAKFLCLPINLVSSIWVLLVRQDRNTRKRVIELLLTFYSILTLIPLICHGINTQSLLFLSLSCVSRIEGFGRDWKERPSVSFCQVCFVSPVCQWLKYRGGCSSWIDCLFLSLLLGSLLVHCIVTGLTPAETL